MTTIADLATEWLQHPALLSMPDDQREKLLELIPSNNCTEAVARLARVDRAVVATLRRVRRNERLRVRRLLAKRALTVAEPAPVEVKPAKIQPAPKRIDPFVAILARHHPYAHCEPTGETVHGWASSHSGKREWSTADMARLRAPTVVCTVSMLDALA